MYCAVHVSSTFPPAVFEGIRPSSSLFPIRSAEDLFHHALSVILRGHAARNALLVPRAAIIRATRFAGMAHAIFAAPCGIVQFVTRAMKSLVIRHVPPALHSVQARGLRHFPRQQPSGPGIRISDAGQGQHHQQRSEPNMHYRALIKTPSTSKRRGKGSAASKMPDQKIGRAHV